MRIVEEIIELEDGHSDTKMNLLIKNTIIMKRVMDYFRK